MNHEPQILDLDKVLAEKAPKIYNKVPRFAINYLKRKIHLDELNEILTIYADKYGVDFMQAVVGYFNLTLETSGLENIQDDRKYIFVSNHPLGGLDGICLSAVIGERFDKKIKYVVNDVLYFIKNLQPIFLPRIPLSDLEQNRTVLLPAPYPVFLDRYFSPDVQIPFNIENIEILELSTADSPTEEASLELEKIWIE